MSETYLIRFATPADVPAVFDLIRALAEYEKLTHLLTGDVQTLNDHLFGEKPHAEVLVAEVARQVVGFALFFSNYSTFLTRSGLYLEDIFVLPSHRGQGIGKALLTQVARVAIERGAGRLEWTVLDWNQPAIEFYQKMGANILEDWRVCRVTGEALQALGSRSN